VDSIPRPNGIAFFPNQKKILIACSDGRKPNWYVYDIQGDKLTNGKIFYSSLGVDKTWKGAPDGLKIGKNGIVYATGPGGIYFFNREGKKLGLLRLDQSTSNCALSADEKNLYVTNDMYVLSIKLLN
jgi:gluconolactonase